MACRFSVTSETKQEHHSRLFLSLCPRESLGHTSRAGKEAEAINASKESHFLETSNKAADQAVNRSTRSGVFQIEAVLARARLRQSFAFRILFPPSDLRMC